MNSNNQEIGLPKSKDDLNLLELSLHQGWINDVSKIKEYKSYLEMLKMMISLEKIEDYFKSDDSNFDDQEKMKIAEKDKAAFEYFITKFSKDTIATIVKQSFLFGENADFIALDILNHYVSLMMKHLYNKELSQEYLLLFDNIKDIFSPDKVFYVGSYIPKQGKEVDKNSIEVKQLGVDSYNVRLKRNDISVIEEQDFDPATNITTLKFKYIHNYKSGDYIDVLIDNKLVESGNNQNNFFISAFNILSSQHTLHYYDKKVWTRGIIKDVLSDTLLVNVSEVESLIGIKLSSFDYAPKNTKAVNYDFATSLKVGDLVFCQDRGRLFPSTIIQKNEKNINGLPYINYRVGFRLYVKNNYKYDDSIILKIAKKYYSLEIKKDGSGNEYYGDSENLDESIPHFSKKIMPFESLENLPNLNEENVERPTYKILEDFYYQDSLCYFSKDLSNFNDEYNPKNDKSIYNLLVGRPRYFGHFYYLLLEEFCNKGYLDSIVNYFQVSENHTPNVDVLNSLINILSSVTCHLHLSYIKSFMAGNVIKGLVEYTTQISQNDMKKIKKETVSNIIKILKFFDLFNYFGNQKKENNFNFDADLFGLNFAIKLIKSPMLSKRIEALKIIVDVIKSAKKQSKEAKKRIAELISKNDLFVEIFGSNSHVQLINKSKDLLEVLFSENIIQNEEIELIWNSTLKGENESKITIIKILKDIHKGLDIEKLKFLLDLVFTIDPNDSHPEELNLLADLTKSYHQKTNDLNLIKTYILWTCKGLYNIKGNKSERIKTHHKKIFDWLNKSRELKDFYTNYLIDETKQMKNVPQNLRQLRVLIRDKLNLSKDEKELFISLVKDSFKSYNLKVKELLKNKKIDPNDIEIDNMSNKQNISIRSMYLLMLITKNIWSLEDIENPIELAYEILYKNANLEEDTIEFFDFCTNLIKFTEENNKNKSDSEKQNIANTNAEDITNEINEDEKNEVENQKQNSELNDLIVLIDNYLLKIFNEKILKIDDIETDSNSKYSNCSNDLFQCYIYLFFKYNKNKNNLVYDISLGNNQTYNYCNIVLYKYPDDLCYFKGIWDMIFYSKNSTIMNAGIKILSQMFATIRINDQIENGSELLLIKTIEMIKSSSNNAFIIEKCFAILKNIIVESELLFTYSNYGVKSHISNIKKRPITMKVINFTRKQDDFMITVYGNTTILELKNIIHLKAKVHVDFMDFGYNRFENPGALFRTLTKDLNGLTCEDMEFSNTTELKILNNTLNERIPMVDLVNFVKNDTGEVVPLSMASQGNVKIDITPRLREIFKSWHTKYSILEDGERKMTRDTCAKFISDVTASREVIGPESKKISGLFSEYDKENKGYISEEHFIEFFKSSTISPDKRKVVWENLRTMGIRNDLKSIEEPYFINELDNNKSLIEFLPRRKISYNTELFNSIFSLLKSNKNIENTNSIEKDIDDTSKNIQHLAFEFLCYICTNPEILLTIKSDLNKTKDLLSKSNIYELSYYLHIIQSIIEGIDFKTITESDNIETLEKKPSLKKKVSKNDENKVVDNEILNVNSTHSNNIFEGINWMKNFINSEGVRILAQITLEKLGSIANTRNKSGILNPKTSEVENKIILDLLKIVKTFYFISLSSTSKGYLHICKTEFESNNIFIEEDLAKYVQKSINFTEFLNFLIIIINDLIGIGNSSNLMNADLILETYEILIGILSYCEEQKAIDFEEEIIKDNNKQKLFLKCIYFGLFSKNSDLKICAKNNLIILIKALAFYKRNSFLILLLNECYSIFEENMKQENPLLTKEYFNVFQTFIDCYFNCSYNDKVESHSYFNGCSINFKNILFSPEEFIFSLASKIRDIIMIKKGLKSDYSKNLEISNFIKFLPNLIELITFSVGSSNNVKSKINENTNLISIITENILFEENNFNEIINIDQNDLINIEDYFKKNSKLGDDEVLKLACFKLISTLIGTNFSNISKFFSLNIFLNKSNKNEEVNKSNNSLDVDSNSDENACDGEDDDSYKEFEDFIPKNYRKSVEKANQQKSENHVGLYNLGAICYANSVIQQLFMVKPFRYRLLKSSDLDPIENSRDENHFHQFQRMFSFLELSQRQYFNPLYFCYSFKDWDDMPINTGIQNDSQEFITRLIDKMEDNLRPTDMKYLFNSIFCLKYISQVKCTNGCNSVSNRIEEMYTLCLDIKGVTNIHQSLESYIQDEKIDSFQCDACKKKVTIIKKNMLYDLPNVLMIHLKRLNYDVEFDKNVKINTRLEFPKELNLKKYCIEEVTRLSKQNENKDKKDEKNEEELENDDLIYMKSDQYYEYNLQGVVVHLGCADAGHYYSYINIERDGTDNIPDFDFNDTEKAKAWLEFNDKNIRKFNFNNLEEECFGGSKGGNNSSYMSMLRFDQSAYILFYDKKVKNPIKVKVPDNNFEDFKANHDNLNIITLNDENKLKILRKYNLNQYDSKSTEYQEIMSTLKNTLFLDKTQNNEYFFFENFYDIKSKEMKKAYFLEILKDNHSLSRSLNIGDASFSEFYYSIIKNLEKSIDENPLLIKLLTDDSLDDEILNNSDSLNSVSDKLFIEDLKKSNLYDDDKSIFISNIDNFRKSFIQNISYYITNILVDGKNNEMNDCLKESLNSLLNIFRKNKRLMTLFLIDLKNKFHSHYSYLLINESPQIVNIFSDFLEVLFLTVLEDYKKKIESNKLTIDEIVVIQKIPTFSKLLFPIFDEILSLFPKIPTRFVTKIGGIFKFLKNIIITDNKETNIFLNYLTKNLKEFIFIFVTYLLGRDSPRYEDTITKKNEKWDYYRSFPANSEDIITIITYIFNEEQSSLTERDNDCIKSSSFVKLLLRKNINSFISISSEISLENEIKTNMICTEITKVIDDVMFSDTMSLKNILASCKKILKINDSFQMNRFNSIIGYPQLKMDTFIYNYNFPLFGFNAMTDSQSKIYEFKSNLRQNTSSCLLYKAFMYYENFVQFSEFFLELLDQCKDNIELFKYIKDMPTENLYYKNLIEFGISIINNQYEKSPSDTKNYKMRLDSIVSYLNDNCVDILDKELGLLDNFNNFHIGYIPDKVKVEEIQFIYEKADCMVLQIDYYTSYRLYDQNMDFSNSISYKNKKSDYVEDLNDTDLYSDGKIENNTEIFEDIEKYKDEFSIVVKSSDRPVIEREFLMKYLNELKERKNIKVINPEIIENYTHTFTRICLFNRK